MKKSHIIGLVMIAAAVVTIALAVGNTSLYVGFKEAREHPGHEYHVAGVWDKAKGMEYNPAKDPNYFSFYLEDSLRNECKVVYRNNKPQDFEHSEKIVIVGKIDNNEFQASSILMKCPSKYNNRPDSKETSSN